MYPILKKRRLSDQIYYMDILAPRTARSCQPGQFVIVKIDEAGERIPLTICDYDRAQGTVAIVFQTVGASTKRMALLEEGDSFRDFAGPLGCPSELIHKTPEELRQMNLLFVAGGVGTAPVYPQVKWLHEQGVKADCIIGARNKSLVILEQEMKQVAANLYVATDDGSYGFHGNVNDQIKELVQNQGHTYDLVVAIGPLVMMKFVSILTKELQIPTVVSMNPIMVDGTGMCGACRLSVGGEIKFACVDGPEFDGHLVDFDQAIKRQAIYKTEEGRALLKLQEGKTHHGGCGQCGDHEHNGNATNDSIHNKTGKINTDNNADIKNSSNSNGNTKNSPNSNDNIKNNSNSTCNADNTIHNDAHNRKEAH
ncbi:MAG: sulfide/dihydroorotate dehydrogenase-like FAD/NAD-binding protein [Lachnospiraceae bacterium]|nr:sulfide/dihydroorotate dehydrogenase-like FAD/NAD-binding protein [Lachnospiraceae bacterium]